MSKTSFWDHPIEKLEEALHIKKQIHELQSRLSSLFSSNDDEPTVKAKAPAAEPKRRGGKRVFSAATRAKMAASQQARRARALGAKVVSAAVAPTKRKKKRNLSPEGRARIVAASKARHAAKRAAKK